MPELRHGADPGDAHALVTGASSGIGAAFARALARRGHRLILVARRGDRLAALAAELGGPDRVRVVRLDLAAPDAAARLQEAVEAAGAHVELLVNNAGVGHTGRFHEQPLDRVLGMIDLNARATTELARRFVPAMIRRGGGVVVNVVSMAAFQPVPYLSVYAATKAYLLALTEAMDTELAGTGVRVQALCPGNIPTEFQQVAGTEHAKFTRMPPMSPETVVAASLAALEARRHRVIVIPGIQDRASVVAQRLVPRSMVRRIAAGLFKPAD